MEIVNTQAVLIVLVYPTMMTCPTVKIAADKVTVAFTGIGSIQAVGIPVFIGKGVQVHPEIMGLALQAADSSLDLSTQKLGKAPKGFTAKVAGQGKPGKAIVHEDEIPNLVGAGKVKGRLIEVTGGSTNANHYTLVMLDAMAPNDFSGSLRFRITGGKTMPVAGIAFRAQDEKNYYLLEILRLWGPAGAARAGGFRNQHLTRRELNGASAARPVLLRRNRASRLAEQKRLG